jgi:hypothetical protein
MSYRPDLDSNSEWPDDIDRLFDLMGQQDPAPGRAFDGTMESLRRWHTSAVSPAKSSGLVKFWSSFSLAKLSMVGGLCLALVAVVWITWINSNPTADQAAKQATVLVMSQPTAEAEKSSAYPFTATMEISESDVPTIPKYFRPATTTQATATQISSSPVVPRYSNLDKLAELELSISGSSIVSTHDSRNEDNSKLRRTSNLR